MVQDQDVALKKLQKPRLQPTFIYGFCLLGELVGGGGPGDAFEI